MRSLWKRSNIKVLNLDEMYRIYDRSTVILKKYSGRRFEVYMGNKFSSILVKHSMVGYKFGEFSLTKKLGMDIHYKVKKKKFKKK